MKKLSANPLVAIVVNTVDRPQDLRRGLEAVLGQRYRHFEVVVVNNGVGPETPQLLSELGKQFHSAGVPFKVVNDKTKKLSYLFNLGWKNASEGAEIFAYAADDTEPDKDWLANIVSYLVANPNCGGVSGPTLSTTQPPGEMFALYDSMKKRLITRILLRLYEFFVMEDKTFEPGHWPESGAFTMGAGIPLPHIKEPIEIDLLTSGNMGVTREAMESINGFDEHFYFNHADGDLFIRLRKAGWKLVFHPGVKVLHHMRFGPTRYPEIMGRDTAFYYLKDVRPHSLRGWLGLKMNLGVFLAYWVFKAWQTKNITQLKGLTGFLAGIRDFFLTPSPERNELLKTVGVIVAFFLLFGQAVRKGFVPGMPAFGDGWPFPPTTIIAWQSFTAFWDLHNPGLTMPVMPVISALLPFETILGTLLANQMVIAARLFYFYLPIPMVFCVMYCLLGKFFHSRLAKFTASFIYAVNFITIGELLGGYVPNIYAQVVFPLALYALYRRRFFSFSLLFALAFILSDHVILFIAPFFLVFLIGGFINGRWRGLVKSFLFITGSALLVILLTLPYTIYYFELTLPFLGGRPLRPDVLLFLVRNVNDTYRYYTLGDSLRLGGSSYINLYNLSNFAVKLGFVLPLLAFSWIIFPANRVARRFKIGLLFTFLALTAVAFIYDAHRSEAITLFHRFPFLFRFRNPSRPTMFLTLAYAPMIALSIEGLLRSLEKFHRPVISRLILIPTFIAIFFGLSIYLQPFFSGDYTFSKNRGTTYTVSSRYGEIGQWLENRRREEGNFRTLWLPYNHEEVEIKTRYIDPAPYAVPINYGAYTLNGYLQHLTSAYRAVAEEKAEALPLLASAGVKYIILNNNSGDSGRPRFEYDYQTPWLPGAPGAWRVVLSSLKLTTIGEVAGFSIYENQEYQKQNVDPVLAGWPPPDLAKKQLIKDISIALSLLALALTVGGSLYYHKRFLKR